MYSCLRALMEAVEDAGVALVTCVPGHPITDLAEALGCAKIAINEKVALEVALGRSASGGRALVVVKNVGMNILADPLVISATMTIGAGLVVLVGDDIGPEGSQAEMDSRHYGPLAMLPLLDASVASSLYSSLIEAFSLSERMRAPTIVRLTSGVIQSSGGDPPARRELAPPGGGFEREIWDLTARGRHQRYHKRIFPIAREASESSSLNRILWEDDSSIGIIAAGRPAALAAGLGYPVLALGYAHPLPVNLIRSFLDRHESVLVAEEPGPFIESRLQFRGGVYGRLTGDLSQGEVTLEGLRRAIDRIEAAPGAAPSTTAAPAPAALPSTGAAALPPASLPGSVAAQASSAALLEERALPGRRGICLDCPYLPLYRALAGLDRTVAGDAGCSIMAVRNPPAVDMVYGLGSSIGVASGFAEKGIALIGDYALAHSGIQGLINALWQDRPVLVVLLENERAAMTGGQMVPSLLPVLETLLPIRSIEMPMEGEEEKAIREILLDEISRPGVGLLVARALCPRFPG